MEEKGKRGRDRELPTSFPASQSNIRPTASRQWVWMWNVQTNFIKTGRIRDPLAAAELLCFSALYHRNLRYARHIFSQMDPPNCFSWSTIIRALSESDDDPIQALVLFRLMLVDELVEPNRFTFSSVLKACA
ncbi:hypothetical protein RJ640_009758 [Escallonia rubra]|uniref:Pentatricopeptide repeat-containing protein n=1 Tax=Escallonia rubra TaxID=112253 RepID=A0AA88R5G0_9ASTE|nr:hypothetical protein RJ640_009758 [Escallonia rubra]